MDVLINKKYESYDYTSRYTTVPYYYNTVDDREIYGIGTNLNKNVDYFSHKTIFTDTLESLALKYYNNPTYWWIIANFNNVNDPFIPVYKNYPILKIPSLTKIEFGEGR